MGTRLGQQHCRPTFTALALRLSLALNSTTSNPRSRATNLPKRKPLPPEPEVPPYARTWRQSISRHPGVRPRAWLSPCLWPGFFSLWTKVRATRARNRRIRPTNRHLVRSQTRCLASQPSNHRCSAAAFSRLPTSSANDLGLRTRRQQSAAGQYEYDEPKTIRPQRADERCRILREWQQDLNSSLRTTSGAHRGQGDGVRD